MEVLGQVKIDPSIVQMHYAFLRNNDIMTNEAWFQILDSQFQHYVFYDIGKLFKKDQDITCNNLVDELNGTYYQTVLFRDQTIYYHER